MAWSFITPHWTKKVKKKKKVKKGDPQNLPWPFRRRPGSHTSLHVLGNFAMGSIHSPDGVIRVFVDLLLSTYIFIFFIQFFVCLILFNKRRLSCCTEKKRWKRSKEIEINNNNNQCKYYSINLINKIIIIIIICVILVAKLRNERVILFLSCFFLSLKD